MKTPKLPKFMVCENPMVEQSNTTQFILHTQDPAFLAVIINDAADEQYKNWHHPAAVFNFYVNDDGFMETHKIVPILGFSEEGEDFAPIMNRMSDWYSSYLTDLDRDANKSGYVFRVQDFTPKVKGLKVISDPKMEKFMVVHQGIAKTFETDKDSQIYLSRTYGLTDEDFKDGLINVPKIYRIGDN